MKRSLLLFATASLIACPALADDEKEGWSGSVELGYVSTEGNSESKTLQGRFDSLWKERDHWRNATHFDALNAEADEVRSYFTIKFPLRDTKGDVRGVCGFSTDVTLLVRAEN